MSLGEIRNIEIARGKKLLITANDKKAGLTNGDIVEVRETGKDGILLTNAKRISILFDSFSYGYATTCHKSRGANTAKVILAAASLSEKTCYVGSSRGRASVKLVCPEFEPLLHSVKRNTDRMTVQEAEIQGAELKEARLEERKMT